MFYANTSTHNISTLHTWLDSVFFPPNCRFLSLSTKKEVTGGIYLMFQVRRQGLRMGSWLWRQTPVEEWNHLGKYLNPKRLIMRTLTWIGIRPRPRRRLTINAQNVGRGSSSTQTWLSMKVHTGEKSSVNLKCVRVLVLLDIRKSTLERRVISVMSVGKPFREVHTLSDIRKSILARSLISVRSVEKSLARMQAFWNISESILERNLTCVSTVERTFGAALTLIDTREFTVRRSPVSARSVGKPLVRPYSSPTVRESTATPKAISVTSVGKPSVWPQTLFDTTGFTLEKNLSSVPYARKPSD